MMTRRGWYSSDSSEEEVFFLFSYRGIYLGFGMTNRVDGPRGHPARHLQARGQSCLQNSLVLSNNTPLNAHYVQAGGRL